MSILKRLGWQDATRFGGIYCEKTDSYIEDALWFCSTLVADYVIREKDGKYIVTYGGRTENEYDNVADAKHWCEFTHYADKMQPYVKQDSTQRIENWFRAAKPEPTLEDLSVQVGCCLEEVCELLEGLGLKDYDVHEQLNIDADHFKGKSKWAIKKLEKLTHQQRVAITDACCDINVTTIGVLTLLGGIDIMGATNEVIRSNDSKFENGKPIFNEQGKIMKGKDYSKPDLTPFIK